MHQKLEDLGVVCRSNVVSFCAADYGKRIASLSAGAWGSKSSQLQRAWRAAMTSTTSLEYERPSGLASLESTTQTFAI